HKRSKNIFRSRETGELGLIRCILRLQDRNERRPVPWQRVFVPFLDGHKKHKKTQKRFVIYVPFVANSLWSEQSS
ncbi:MAG: hypothetical protein WCG22_07725, partial [Lentisphaerota bacterium]